MRQLGEDERTILRLYRRAAGRLYERFVPYSAHQFRARMFRTGAPDDVDLIPEEAFISLLVAFRICHAQNERTNFGRVANIAYRFGSSEIRSVVEQIRVGWKESFRRPLFFSLHGEHFDAESLLDTWMNGEVFHQDASLQRRVDLIHEEGLLALLTIQWAVRDACFAVLGLDNVCALLLDEDVRPLPPHPSFPVPPAPGNAG